MGLTVLRYVAADGKTPVTEWANTLDTPARAAVLKRFVRMTDGNFGDWKVVKNGNGVRELRIHLGPGYRIYFAREGETVVLLLCGGAKGTQAADIERAKKYWQEWKNHGKSR